MWGQRNLSHHPQPWSGCRFSSRGNTILLTSSPPTGKIRRLIKTWVYKKRMSNPDRSPFVAHLLSPLRCGRDSNSRPHAWQACILTNWTTEPFYLPLSSPPPSNHFAKIQPFLKLPKLFGWKMKKNNKTLVNLLIFRTFANAKKSGLGWFWQRG